MNTQNNNSASAPLLEGISTANTPRDIAKVINENFFYLCESAPTLPTPAGTMTNAEIAQIFAKAAANAGECGDAVMMSKQIADMQTQLAALRDYKAKTDRWFSDNKITLDEDRDCVLESLAEELADAKLYVKCCEALLNENGLDMAQRDFDVERRRVKKRGGVKP